MRTPIQIHPPFRARACKKQRRANREEMASFRRFLYALLLAASLCVSAFDYWRDEGLPLLDLAIRGSIWPQNSDKYKKSRPHNPPSCNCSSNNYNLLANSSKGDTGGNSRTSSARKYVSEETAVEKLVPLSKLKEEINFSRHDGLSFLHHRALNRYYLCAPSTKPISSSYSSYSSGKKSAVMDECRKRRFRQKQGPIVALVSSPGSGNTWLRYLLEQSSGIFTGSIYCDHTLKKSFPGEHIGM